jgi:hypothetical protein
MTQPRYPLKQRDFNEERQRVSRDGAPTYGPAERTGPRTENALLAKLGDRIRRIERPAATVYGVLPFGIAAIDRDGGWSTGDWIMTHVNRLSARNSLLHFV